MRPVADLWVCFEREHLRRTGAITMLVGKWITLSNHFELLLTGGVDAVLAVKVLLNYLTPFAVAYAGFRSRQDRDK